MVTCECWDSVNEFQQVKINCYILFSLPRQKVKAIFMLENCNLILKKTPTTKKHCNQPTKDKKANPHHHPTRPPPKKPPTTKKPNIKPQTKPLGECAPDRIFYCVLSIASHKILLPVDLYSSVKLPRVLLMFLQSCLQFLPMSLSAVFKAKMQPWLSCNNY